MVNLPTEAPYQQLLNRLSVIYERTQQILVEANWHMGREIVENLQTNANRAEYGSHLIKQLSEDLTNKYGAGFSETNLRHMRNFFLTYPIQQTFAELSWGQCISLISIKDENIRKELEVKTVDEKLSCRDLKELVKKRKREAKEQALIEAGKPTVPRLKIALGTVGEFTLAPVKIPTTPGAVTIDYGFGLYCTVSEELATHAVAKSSHTYGAKVISVVDGDTMVVVIESGDTMLKVRLRLAHLNCPERSTAEGEKAKRFVKRRISPGMAIVVQTKKYDRYARYVADLFYLPGERNYETIASQGRHLNQELLDSGIATVY